MSPCSVPKRSVWPVRPTGQGGVQRVCPSGRTNLNLVSPMYACSRQYSCACTLRLLVVAELGVSFNPAFHDTPSSSGFCSPPSLRWLKPR
eukprot:14770158-Alexandrium_andersonii.AAC.1